MTFNEADHPRDGRSKQFVDKVNSAPETVLGSGRDLTGEEPPAVDTELAEIYYEKAKAAAQMSAATKEAGRYRQYINEINERQGGHTYNLQQYEDAVKRAEQRAAHAAERMKVADEEMAPFEDEFDRRGGWTRAFLVTGGHVHSSMHCSTCFPTTSFAWMTDYSGMDEDTVVTDAGERACTVCYPSAPALPSFVKPSKMFTQDEAEAAEAKAQRERERAEKAAVKATKAITNPDGTELREPRQHGKRIASLVSAERELTDVITTYELADARAWRIPNRDMVAQQLVWRDLLVEAIAAKKGITAEQVREEATGKAEKKYKREYGA